MKHFAHHDSNGGIRSIITVNAPKGMTVMLTPKPGEFATEIEDIGVKEGHDVDAVRKAVKNRRIDTSRARPTPLKEYEP